MLEVSNVENKFLNSLFDFFLDLNAIFPYIALVQSDLWSFREGVFPIRMLAGEVGEFEAEMTQVKWEEGNFVIVARGSALWSPLPIMGVWDMKLSIGRDELPKVLRMMASFALRDGFKMIGGLLSRKKPDQVQLK